MMTTDGSGTPHGSLPACTYLGSLIGLFPQHCVCFKVVFSFKVHKLCTITVCQNSFALKFYSGILRFSFILNSITP